MAKMFKKLKERVNNLHISFNKEIVRFVIITIVLVVGFVVGAIISKIYPLLIIMMMVLIVFAYLYFSRYKTLEKKNKRDDLLEFVNLFTFFRIYLKNGYGVYSALKEIATFANPSLKENLIILINEIDNDKSITPFINFAHKFDELLIEEMMVSIYQMIDDGSSSNYLVQFELIFDKFSETLHKEQIELKDHRLANLTATSLIGSAYLIVLITVGVITLIGEMLNGL